MLDKYSLQENVWLQNMFDIKEKWALVYGRKTFCADMTTTQRSESMHSVLKKYVNNKHNLLKFFQKFEKLIDDRRYEELKADMRTCHSTPSLSLDVSILKHARSVYTHKVFKLFQAELSKAHDASVEIISELEIIYKYKITLCKKKYNHTVTYDTSNGMVSCSCRKFEFGGILCAHVLKVFNIHHILEIPKMYISKRWTKHANKGLEEENFELPRSSPVTPGKKKEAQEKIRIGERYRELCRVFNQLVTRAALTEETFAYVKSSCFKNMEVVDMMLGKGMATPEIVATNRTKKHVPESNELEVPSKRKISVPDSNELDMQEFDNVEEDITITDFQGISVRGLKVKKAPKDKSGKRMKGALEQAFSRKRKNKKNSCQAMSFDDALDADNHNVSNNQHSLENGGVQAAITKKKSNKKNNSSSLNLASSNQDLRVSNCNPHTTNFLQMMPYPTLPQISPYYQNQQVGLPGWNLHNQSLRMPYYTNGLPPLPQTNLLQLGQNAGQQFSFNPQQHAEGNQPTPSMMSLLQAQTQPRSFGISFNTTPPDEMQLSRNNEVRDPAKE